MVGLSGRVAVVLGSGLSGLATSLAGGRTVPYSELPGMPAARVPGHEGSLYAGKVRDVPVLVFAGRPHLYEGHGPGAVTRWVAIAREAGCEVAVITNAAGAVNTGLRVGAPCLISDHINLTGHNPLVGAPAFVDMTYAYDEDLRTLARSVDPTLEEGVYAGLLGPSYETPAEIRMLSALGADLVGMSTVLEAIAARHLGMRVLGISLVTNVAAGLRREPLGHEEVAEASRHAGPRLEALLREVITRL